ncbi:MAG: hypothetical protein CMC79_02815 [Flavobacteriaceae bacterium]|nr:hypothetical protein [Flavobacteriaceae bacterium]|tara:strand:- start:9900 stop:12236 length:2337 start_codon:yes stop_codon:yes gene_type:complete
MSIANNRSDIDTSNFIPSILIIAYLLVGFVPNMEAVDKVSPQWVYMNIVNIFSSIYLFVNRNNFQKIIKNLIYTGISIFYISFFVWTALSYFYAINPIEALVNIPRHLNTLLMYLFIGIFIHNVRNKNRLISWCIAIILTVEVYAVFVQAMDMINTTGSIYTDNLKGVTANRNITAFSIALKIPFILYLLENIKGKFFKISLFMLVTFALIDLSMIESRASFLGVGLILFGYLFICGYKYILINKNKRVFYNLGYYILPLFFSILVNQLYFSNKGADAVSRAATIAINTSDDSISKRLRYYEDVMTHMFSNPIFGTGIGNWKFESIRYDRLDIDGYIVPYHAHSDFIQLGAELGFIGFFLYILVFVSAVYFVFFILFKSKISNTDKLFSFFLILSLGVYLIDANLNFPIARPQELAPWALVMALINFYYVRAKLNEKQLNKKPLPSLKMAFPIVSLILLLPGLFVTHKTYKSQIAQMIILNDFNSDKHNIPLNQIETYIPSIPNVTVTTIPMDAIKARYYFHYQKYDKALEYAIKSELANPYLSYGDIIIYKVYRLKGNLEKAKEAVKKAFKNLPNNNLHMGEYAKLIIDLQDDNELEEAYPLMTGTNKKNGWKTYLVAKSTMVPAGDPIYIKRAEKAVKLFPLDNEFKKILKTARIGDNNISAAFSLGEQARIKYQEQSYLEAAQLYDKATDLDPYEYSYFENAALSYYSIQDGENALKRINVVVDQMNPLNGKCEYIKGLIYLQYGLTNEACDLFKTSESSGYGDAKTLQQQYCSN